MTLARKLLKEPVTVLSTTNSTESSLGTNSDLHTDRPVTSIIMVKKTKTQATEKKNNSQFCG
jgi:hypothetical protein